MTPLVTQISWTNQLLIMSGCKTDEEREFYIFCKRGGNTSSDIYGNVFVKKIASINNSKR